MIGFSPLFFTSFVLYRIFELHQKLLIALTFLVSVFEL